jgi:hypothetical protein
MNCWIRQPRAEQAAEKVNIAEKHPSGAEAHRFFSSICGTTEVVPFQNSTFTTGRETQG